ncbi:MAG: IPT/TIG domain-containing protein, partial [Terracidiphilus sp.]
MPVACLRASVPPRTPLPTPGLLWTSLLFVISLPLVVPLISGCGDASLAVDLNTIAAIGSPATSVRVNQTVQLTSSYLASGLPMTFYVNEIAGGNATVGTISSAGVYTAPAVVPNPYTVQITSSIAKYPTAAPGSVSIQVWNPIPVLGTVTPNGFSEGSTTVIVNGSQFVYGAQISWNGAFVTTTYVSSTELVAQIGAPNPGTYPLTVTNPNPGSASALPLSLKVGPGQVVLTLQPNSGTDVRVSNSLNLGLMVNGTDNPAVTLQVNGIAGGNGVVGTAVSNANGSITYTAPPVVPTPSNIVQLTITSVDNPAVSITQN